MNELEKIATSEKAYQDYLLRMKYKDIAEKYGVSINTVKSWRKRYKWTRDCTQKKGCSASGVQSLGNNSRDKVREDMLKQLTDNGITQKDYEDLVEDYMSLWDVKNRLIQDIQEKGVSIRWTNGKQSGFKRNDSVVDLPKISAQMIKIREYLGLKPSKADEDYDDI